MGQEHEAAASAREEDEGARDSMVRRHQRFGWWALFAFASLGLVLESLAGLRVPWYVDVATETRRHMLTLAHAHGTLLALVNLAFGLGVERGIVGPSRTASGCLRAAAGLVPVGFATGGLVIHDGDPGLGILLVPVGALLLIVGALLAARSIRG